MLSSVRHRDVQPPRQFSPCASLAAGPRSSRSPTPSSYGQRAVVETLIKGGADVNAPDESGLTPLALAAMQGQTAIARLLIAAKADVNEASSDGTTPLMRAASANHGETVRLLIASGADVNARNAGGMTALMVAAFGGYAEPVRMLLASQGRRECEGQPVAHGARWRR